MQRIPREAHALTLWHDGPIHAATWRADGLQIVSGGYESRIYVWDALTKQRPLKLEHPKEKTMHVRGIAWSPDREKILSWDVLTGCQVWNATTGEHLLSIGPDAFNAAWSRDGSRILATSQNTIRILDATTGKALRTIRAPGAYLITGAWNRDETKILACSYGAPLTIHPAARGSALVELEDSKGVWRARWSADDSRVLFGNSDVATPAIWDARSGAKVTTFESQERHAAWSPDESRVVFYDKRITVCDASTANVLWSIESADDIRGIDWHPDGSRFLSFRFGVHVYAADHPTPLVHIDSQSFARVARWSPDGRRIVTGGDTRDLMIWDVS